jgi:hypothetical protein
MNDMAAPSVHSVERFAQLLGNSGKIQINQNVITALSFYNAATETQIEVLKGLSEMRKKILEDGDYEKRDKIDK